MLKMFIDDINPGAVIAKDILDIDGRMLVSNGTIVRDEFIQRLRNLGINEVYIKSDNREFNQQDFFQQKFSKHEFIQKEDDIKKGLHIDDIIYEKTRVQAQMQVKKVMVRLGTMGHTNITKINIIVEDIIQQLLSKKDIVLTLSKLRSIDDYTYEHSVNVCVLSLVVGVDLFLDKDSLRSLGTGAILHDIGKVGISEDILKKPSKLSYDEFEEIKKHTELGYDILTKTNVPEESAEIALCHHEKFDGSGYPKKIRGSKIPLFARIVAVSDVYDAISNDRVYRKKISPDKAFKLIIRSENAHFDTEVMEKFVNHLNLYPTGTGVILNTNHKAIVIGQNKLLPESPIIRLFRKEKNDIKNLYVDVDLSLTKHLYIKDTF